MMVRLTTLTVRNFLSYGNNVTVFPLERVGTTLILGEDLDQTTEGKTANGVGKSAIINALAYALYDKPVSKVAKIDMLVNNINNKNMEVTLEFIGATGKTYRIVRQRKMKAGAAGNNVFFYEDGVDKSVDAGGTNRMIEEAFGMPYELFVRIVVFSATHTPFLLLPATHATAPNQKDIIEELFGLTAMSDKAKLLKEHIKDAETALTLKKSKVDLLEKEAVRHTTLIESAKKRVESWKVQNASTIDSLIAKLERIESVNFEEEQTLHTYADKVKVKQAALQSELTLQQRSNRQQNLALEAAVKDLRHLKDAKCPYCLQDFKEAMAKLVDVEKTIEDLDAELKYSAMMIQEHSGDLADYAAELKKVQELITVPNLRELQEIKNESSNIKLKIVELGQAENPFVAQLQELIDVEAERETIDYAEVNEATKQLEHQKFLLKLLTKSDSFVRKALLNKNIPYLNQRVQYYLSLIGLPHQVEFTHDMTANITKYGRELDFSLLSAGQAARVNIALSFAFKDVLQRLHAKINICMLDEILDHGLDAVGVAMTARLVKRKARDEGLSMYIISHKSEVDSVFDKTLTIQMSKGFSFVKED